MLGPCGGRDWKLGEVLGSSKFLDTPQTTNIPHPVEPENHPFEEEQFFFPGHSKIDLPTPW